MPKRYPGNGNKKKSHRKQIAGRGQGGKKRVTNKRGIDGPHGYRKRRGTPYLHLFVSTLRRSSVIPGSI